jgi:HEAT repeat protein
MMCKHAASALPALREALDDPDERVRKVAGAAIEYIEAAGASF